MGQKTNSNILRLGINNNDWKSKYYSKTLEESSLLVFQDLQIRTYIKQLLISQGLIFHDYKLYINANVINIHISYYNSPKSFFLINKITSDQKLKLKKRKYFNNQKFKKQTTNKISFLKQSHFLEKPKYQKRNTLLKKYKTKFIKNKYTNNKNLQKNSFIEQLLEGLNLFVQKKHNIQLTFQNLNSSLNINLDRNEQKLWKKKLLTIKRYSKNKFFKEAINILLITIKCKNSAQLLADFIAKQFTVLKRQSYFLIFIKRALNLFLEIPQSKISGVKIITKGRFNSAPRARNNIISVGSVPVQTLSTNIDYYQSVSFSSNGTFGIKVWICEKK